MVLMQGVLKRQLMSPVSLRPLGIIRTAKDPPIHVLGLDNEHAISGYDDMVDLRRAHTRVNRHVVQVNVVRRSKEDLLRDDGLELANPAFEHDTQRNLIPSCCYARRSHVMRARSAKVRSPSIGRLFRTEVRSCAHYARIMLMRGGVRFTECSLLEALHHEARSAALSDRRLDS